MNTQSHMTDYFQERIAYCRGQRSAYEGWLGVLRPARWVMTVGSVVLSAAAGLTILSGDKYLGGNWELYAALFSFAAGILTTLHSALHCDAYQAECDRIIQSYESMEQEYEAARILAPDELKVRGEKLQTELAMLIKSAGARPPKFFRNRAASSNHVAA